jgi:16S rRNA (uracil1498-N3)-methyltransferase
MKHQFALYYDSLKAVQSIESGSTLIIDDLDVIRRITSVLRLKPSQELILFDEQIHVAVTLQDMQKKKIVCTVHTVTTNKKLEPTIIALLPLLKREALEQALYASVELGASTVQPVVTNKSLQQWSPKEKERYHRIMIAAAEQSKNFSLPKLADPADLTTAIEEQTDLKIFFDPRGTPLLNMMNEIKEKKPKSILFLVGPEGDLMIDEKSMLQEKNVTFCALTPTVLRAYQAFIVGLGALRSVATN